MPTLALLAALMGAAAAPGAAPRATADDVAQLQRSVDALAQRPAVAAARGEQLAAIAQRLVDVDAQLAEGNADPAPLQSAHRDLAEIAGAVDPDGDRLETLRSQAALRALEEAEARLAQSDVFAARNALGVAWLELTRARDLAMSH